MNYLNTLDVTRKVLVKTGGGLYISGPKLPEEEQATCVIQYGRVFKDPKHWDDGGNSRKVC